MKYNPKDIPEGINVAKGHPLRDFLKLTLICSIGAAFIYISLGFISDQLVKSISMHHEVVFFKKAAHLRNKFHPGNKSSKNLEEIVNQLWSHYPESKDTPLTTSLIQQDQLNAFMGLGGNLMVTSGSIKQLKTKNEIAFVICHEIGHFYKRHIIKSMGRKLSIAMLTSFLGISEKTGTFFESATEMGHLSFGRTQEKEADLFAIDCMMNEFGHVEGHDQFFNLVQKLPGLGLRDNKLLSYSSTHPLTKERLQNLKDYIKEKGFPSQGKTTLHQITTKPE